MAKKDTTNDKIKDTSVLSYNRFLIDRKRFQRAGTQDTDEFNLYDTPAHKYFKIFFYFGSDANGKSTTMRNYNGTDVLSGLLAPSWLDDYIKNVKSAYDKDLINPDKQIVLTEKNPVAAKDIIKGVSKDSNDELNKQIESINLRSYDYYGIDPTATNATETLKTRKATDIANLNRKNIMEQASTVYQKMAQYTGYTGDIIEANRYIFNDAYSYLLLNGKYNAAENLKTFIELLSNISIKSPWYFTNVNGVQEALDRKQIDTGKMDGLDERRKLTITCLPDAFDNRIGTLLELYRSCTWDWINKREIIPSNLRKFDMAIYIFEAPDEIWHKDNVKPLDSLGDKWKNAAAGVISNLNVDTAINKLENQITDYTDINNFSKFKETDKDKIGFCPSFKLIEFHDCEFNYNSIKSAWTELNNQTGMSPTYTIEITYGDCYDLSYNDLLMKAIGDSLIVSSEAWIEAQEEHIQKRMMSGADDSWLLKLGVGAANRISDMALGFVKQAAYGNLYGLSLTNVLSDIGNAIQDPMSAYDSVMKYASNGKEMLQQTNKQASSLVNSVKRTAVNSVNMKQFQNEYSSADTDERTDFNKAAVNPAGIVKTSREEFKSRENVFSGTKPNTGNNNSFENIFSDTKYTKPNTGNNNSFENIFSDTEDTKPDTGNNGFENIFSDTESNIDNKSLSDVLNNELNSTNIFTEYTKNKIKYKNNKSGIGNLYKSTSVANNL